MMLGRSATNAAIFKLGRDRAKLIEAVDVARQMAVPSDRQIKLIALRLQRLARTNASANDLLSKDERAF